MGGGIFALGGSLCFQSLRSSAYGFHAKSVNLKVWIDRKSKQLPSIAINQSLMLPVVKSGGSHNTKKSLQNLVTPVCNAMKHTDGDLNLL